MGTLHARNPKSGFARLEKNEVLSTHLRFLYQLNSRRCYRNMPARSLLRARHGSAFILDERGQRIEGCSEIHARTSSSRRLRSVAKGRPIGLLTLEYHNWTHGADPPDRCLFGEVGYQ